MVKNHIPADTLDEMIIATSNTLDALRSAKGKKVDRVTELCEITGISKRSLAAGIILEEKGDITAIELAKRISINRCTIYNWKEIHRVLRPDKPEAEHNPYYD